MVRRQASLGRRLRANLGAIVNTALWAGAALTCLVLYVAGPAAGPTRAVAVVQRHPVVVPASGRLVTIEVQAGDPVEAGRVLATVEVPGLRSQLAAAEAELRALQVSMESGNPGEARRFAKDTAGAQARWLASRVELESLRAEAVGADLELARLRSPGVGVAAAEIEVREAARTALAARISALEEEAAALERAYEVARGLESSGVDALLEAQVQAAAARVDELVALQAAAALIAPVTGTVSAIAETRGASPLDVGTLPAPGAWLQAGVPALAIVQPHTDTAMSWLSPAQARTLQAGASLTLHAADGNDVTAQVVSVGAAVEPVPLRQLADPTVLEWGVPVTVRAPGAQLMPGEDFSISGL